MQSERSLFGHILAELIASGEITDAEFCRRVNARATAEGVPLGLSRTTVGHWRRGMRPRDPRAARLAADVLSALTGATYTPTELGWPGGEGNPDLALDLADTTGGVVGVLIGILPRLLHPTSATSATSTTPASSHRTFAPDFYLDAAMLSRTGVIPAIPDDREDDVPTRTDATRAETTTSIIADSMVRFRAHDARFGSVDIVWRQTITLLDDAATAVRGMPPDRDTFGALSEITQFAGWLARDRGSHPTAQRFYIQALALAEHAGDVGRSARAISAMSEHCARFPRQSISLADSAFHRAGDDASPLVRAILYNRLAWAHARAGKHEAMDHVDAMQRAVDRARPGDGPAWAAHVTAADVAELRGYCLRLLGDAQAAIPHLVEARQKQAPGRVRARTYTLADLALAYLSVNKLDAAIDAGNAALDLAATIRSGWVSGKLVELDAAFARVRGSGPAREWQSRFRRGLTTA